MVEQGTLSIQDVNVIHMIQLDMFFLFLGTPMVVAPGTVPKEYFYVTKNLLVREEPLCIHT